MGYSNWSDQAYRSRQNTRKRTRQTAFTYDRQVRVTGRHEVHPEMDPYGATRESRDSAEHPASLAIGVVFDVTGSMGSVPRVMQTKLGALMRLLIQRGYVAHPQILFGAVGDAFCDRVPLQIGQFESGLEMDDDLAKIYLEGGGGGQIFESYELTAYFFARHTAIDCWEKRGKKGYLFTIGDEKPYPVVRSEQVRRLLGDPVSVDIPTAAIVHELQQRYETFHIIPTQTAHGESADVQACWRDLMGERVLLLADEGAVCETIALAIGLCEGTVWDLQAVTQDLTGAGYDPNAVQSASRAVAPYLAARGPVDPVARGTVPASTAPADDGRL